MSDPHPDGDPPDPDEETVRMTPAPGALPERLGRYQALAKLGSGGMGSVYLAHDPVMGRQVALKVIAPRLLSDPAVVARFRREIQVIAKLHHPQIVTAFDAHLDRDNHFLVMEYVPGTDLAKLVRQVGPLPASAAADYIEQAALGLQHAHEARLVHRDLKPSNLLVGPGGQVKIADLGLARLADEGGGSAHETQSGSTLGTPDYMAPEQADDPRVADIRADIYSLGCTLYHLLAGQVPFPAPGHAAKLISHQQAEPRPLEELRPGLPAGLADVVRTMMAKHPDRRYQTPADAARALRPFARREAVGLGAAGPPDTQPEPGTNPDRHAAVDPPSTAPAPETTLAATPWHERMGTAAPAPASTVADPAVAPAPTGDVRRSLGWVLAAAAVGIAGVVLLRPFLVKSVVPRPDLVATPAIVPAPVAPTVGPPHEVASVPAPPAPTLEPHFLNSIGMKLVAIPAGTFLMGSPDDEPQRDPNEGPRHRVTISRPFYLGAAEVTQAEYVEVMGANPSHFCLSGPGARFVEGFDTSRMPVESVSWADAREFCDRLSRRDAEARAGRSYRLPTEAEWEYACRAGTTGPFSVGDRLKPDLANYNALQPYAGAAAGSPSRSPVNVASFAPNAFGLYDMHGNVTEWCRDVLRAGDRAPCGPPCGYYTEAPRTDPLVETLGGAFRVARGGAFPMPAAECRSAARALWVPDKHEYYCGLRVACVLKAPTVPSR